MLEKASTIINALTLIRPTSQWVLRNDPCDYDSLEWLDSEQIKPTEEELLTAINTSSKYNHKKKYRIDFSNKKIRFLLKLF